MKHLEMLQRPRLILRCQEFRWGNGSTGVLLDSWQIMQQASRVLKKTLATAPYALPGTQITLLEVASSEARRHTRPK